MALLAIYIPYSVGPRPNEGTTNLSGRDLLADLTGRMRAARERLRVGRLSSVPDTSPPPSHGEFAGVMSQFLHQTSSPSKAPPRPTELPPALTPRAPTMVAPMVPPAPTSFPPAPTGGVRKGTTLPPAPIKATSGTSAGSEVDELRAMVDELEKRLDTGFSHVSKDVAKLDKQNHALEDALQEALYNQGLLEAKYQKLEEEHEAMKAESDRSAKMLEKLLGHMGAIAEEVERLHHQDKRSKGEFEALEGAIDAIKHELGRVERKTDMNHANLNRATKGIGELGQKILDSLKMSQRRTDKLAAEIGVNEVNIGKLHKELWKVCRVVVRMEDELEELNQGQRGGEARRRPMGPKSSQDTAYSSDDTLPPTDTSSGSSKPYGASRSAGGLTKPGALQWPPYPSAPMFSTNSRPRPRPTEMTDEIFEPSGKK